MNKTFLALTTALTLPATAALADMHPFQLYAGVHAGGTFSHTKIKTQSRELGVHVDITGNTGDKFFTGGVFAGMRYHFRNWFTGLEVEGNWDGMNIKVGQLQESIGAPWTLELQRSHQIIPSLTLGWKMNKKTALYGKFGAGISHFDFLEGYGDISFNARNKVIVHFVPAVGIEHELHKNAALRFEVSGEVAGPHIKNNSAIASGNAAQFSKARYNAVSVKFGVLVKI